MSHRNLTTIVLIILAAISAVAVIAVLGMWLMHATMMGWMFNGSSSPMGGGGMMGCGAWLVGLLMMAVVIGAAPVCLAKGTGYGRTEFVFRVAPGVL